MDGIKPELNEEKCIGCGACAAACPNDVFEIKDGKSIVKNPDNCVGCGACENACPLQIIKVKKE